MKKILLLLIIVSILSCKGKAIEQTSNGDFEVEYLFEKDGVKVYRFWDGGSVHYFTNKGETISKKGKYDDNIN
jgi:hypothetical protein